MKYQIWYMKPEWFPMGISGELPDPDNLEKTHTHLMEFVIPRDDLEDLYMSLQGERWSPNGEARPLIESKGLAHTSMSVGDIAVTSDNEKYVVAMHGFKRL